MKAAFKILALFFPLFLSSFSWARNAPMVCNIKAYDGHYLTAVGGGGRTTDVIHTNVTSPGNYEKFTFEDPNEGSAIYGIKTYKGYYLTIVGGGGRTTDVIHSDATNFLAWEKIRTIALGNGWYALQTINDHYLTAVDSGGRTTDVIHSDATRIGTWEMFRIINCKLAPIVTGDQD